MRAIEHVWVYVEALAPAGDALSAAVEVSRRSGAALTILGAIGRSEDRVFQTSFGPRIVKLIREDREERLRALQAYARTSLPAERVRTIMLEGEVPWHCVAAHAAAHSPDLLVVAARPAITAGFDTVSQHLFRKCAAPVWSVYPGRIPFPRRALVAVEPGAAGTGQRQLARSILEFVIRIAGGGPLELHVANVWSLLGEEMLRSKIGEEKTRECLEVQLKSAREEMEELISHPQVRASVTAVHLPKGNPALLIPVLAEELDADLVVLGSAGRTGLEGQFIGGTAEAIVAGLARSVAVVKPPGFVSPVPPAGESGGTGVRR